MDSDSKKKVRKLLKAEAAMKMDVDGKRKVPRSKGGVTKKKATVMKQAAPGTDNLIAEMVLG